MEKPARSKRAPAKKKASGPDQIASTNALLPAPTRRTPIVGIGASAGGLEAMELFLHGVPRTSGLAFVVIQHLDPNYKGILPELLQRHTTMPVVQIQDGMKVEPDHVYVIPPNRDLSILHGTLRLLEPVVLRGLRLPIDFFFRSLAEDQREYSVGVILSGMGSDGTLGLRAIKENAGAVFVQTPSTAKCESMPQSAIEAGFADTVAPAEDLAGRICAYFEHIPFLAPRSDSNMVDTHQSSLDKIIVLLRAQSGHDFSGYKKTTLYRRIERRMGLHQLSNIGDYVRYLRESPQETALLFKELLIGVTSFFRDPDLWEQLKSEAIPSVLASYPNGGALRAWVAGCSTGEEAYSLAMVFREVLDSMRRDIHYSLQIFATDLDHEAIDRARAGQYPANIAADVSPQRLKRFFVEEQGRYRVSKSIREMVIFAQQNLILDPPFTKLDLLSCRNVLIYLEADLQKKLLPLFHYSLNPGGILALGNSETVGQAIDLFELFSGKLRLYRRLGNPPEMIGLNPIPFGFSHTHLDNADMELAPALPSANNLQTLTDALLLQHYSPAAVLTTAQGDIVYFNGKTGEFLEPVVGKANLNIFAMARDGLRLSLSEAFHQAQRKGTIVTLKGVEVGTSGQSQAVDVTVQPLSEPASVRGMVLIIFARVPTPSATPKPTSARKGGDNDPRVAALEQNLQQSREELQTTREEMQSSQEELRSAIEELQATNEELQSTNEELTSSKEEMQSMNEELQTVNFELQAKVDELSHASDDMKNLLNSTHIATLFLDEALKVRRYTPQTTALINLIPGDAGRPVTDLVTALDYPTLTEDVQEVLRTLVFQEHQVPTHDGRWFNVRIMPYRTQDNRIDGVVITFVEISMAKVLESTLGEALSMLQDRPDQAAATESEKNLELILSKAQTVLEKGLKGNYSVEVPAENSHEAKPFSFRGKSAPPSGSTPAEPD